MADALDYIMQVRKEKLLREQQTSESINQGFSNFVDAFVKGRTLQNQQFAQQVELAKSGLKLTPEGFVRDESLMNPTDTLIKQGQVADARLKLAQLGIQPQGGASSGQPQIQVPQGVGGAQPQFLSQAGLSSQNAQTAQPQQNDLFSTESNVLGVPTKFQSESGLLREKAIDTAAKVKGDQAKTLLENNQNFAKVVNLFSNLVSQKKSQLKEVQGGGLAQGLIGKGGAFLRKEGYSKTAAFPGQRTETTLALNSILTGQNRVIEGVTRKIAATLPDEFDTESFSADKVAQSIRNSFGLFKAIHKANLSPEFFSSMTEEQAKNFDITPQKLTKEENDAVNQLIKEILATEEAPDFEFTNDGDDLRVGGSFQGKKILSIRRKS